MADAAEADLLIRRPGPALSGFVTRLVHYTERGRAMAWCEPAGLELPVIIGFADPFGLSLDPGGSRREHHASFASGLTRGPVRVTSAGRAACVQINFTPLGALRFHRLPLGTITDRLVPLCDLDAPVRALSERLAGLPDARARLDAAEALVAARIAAAPPPDRTLARAYAALRRSRGRMPVARLAEAAGWSRQHLSARFSAELGLGPKAVARILRFEAARGMAAAGRAGWAEIAAACGYADQSHLIREFRALGGATPARAVI